MHLDFMVVFSSLMGLFVLIAAGVLIVRLDLVPPEASPYFSALLIKVAVPCTIFISLASREYDPSFVRDSILTVVTGMVVFPAVHYLGRFLGRLLRIPKGKRGVWSFSCAYPNAGFMGFPVCLALFGAEGLALSVIYNIAFNIFVYSIGAMEIAEDAGAEAERPGLRKMFFNGINLSIVLSLIFYFCRIPVPEVAAAPITHLSNITTPLSMLITGMAIGRGRALDLITDRDAWTASAIRLLGCPLLLLAVLSLLPYPNRMVVLVTVVIMGMPVPGVTTVLAETYHGNVDLAAKISFLTNLLCMVTIPVICMLL